MRPGKGHFGVVPYIGNKLFPSFPKKIEKKFYFCKKVIFLEKYFLFLEKHNFLII